LAAHATVKLVAPTLRSENHAALIWLVLDGVMQHAKGHLGYALLIVQPRAPQLPLLVSFSRDSY
jgi:hypothetical protein